MISCMQFKYFWVAWLYVYHSCPTCCTRMTVLQLCCACDGCKSWRAATPYVGRVAAMTGVRAKQCVWWIMCTFARALHVLLCLLSSACVHGHLGTCSMWIFCVMLLLVNLLAFHLHNFLQVLFAQVLCQSCCIGHAFANPVFGSVLWS